MMTHASHHTFSKYLFSAKSPLMQKMAITWSFFGTYFNSETWGVGVTKMSALLLT